MQILFTAYSAQIAYHSYKDVIYASNFDVIEDIVIQLDSKLILMYTYTQVYTVANINGMSRIMEEKQ